MQTRCFAAPRRLRVTALPAVPAELTGSGQDKDPRARPAHPGGSAAGSRLEAHTHRIYSPEKQGFNLHLPQ